MGSFKRAVYMLAPFALYSVLLKTFLVSADMITSAVISSGNGAADLFRRHASAVEYIFNILAYTLTALILLLVFMKSDKPEKAVYAGKSKRVLAIFVAFALGGILSVLLNRMIAFLIDMLGTDEKFYSAASFDPKTTPFIPGLILYVLVSPLLEEMTFRWLMYGRIKKHLGEIAAIILSSLFFGIMHIVPVQVIYASLMGLVIALLYRTKRDLLLCFIFHMAANAFIFIPPYLGTLAN